MFKFVSVQQDTMGCVVDGLCLSWKPGRFRLVYTLLRSSEKTGTAEWILCLTALGADRSVAQSLAVAEIVFVCPNISDDGYAHRLTTHDSPVPLVDSYGKHEYDLYLVGRSDWM